mgnify:CR=1 FL=1|tara:strand:- start:1545 stop:1661 length:117 start_codon:yes stop_codon:yes gene_type:complete
MIDLQEVIDDLYDYIESLEEVIRLAHLKIDNLEREEEK